MANNKMGDGGNFSSGIQDSSSKLTLNPKYNKNENSSFDPTAGGNFGAAIGGSSGNLSDVLKGDGFNNWIGDERKLGSGDAITAPENRKLEYPTTPSISPSMPEIKPRLEYPGNSGFARFTGNADSIAKSISNPKYQLHSQEQQPIQQPRQIPQGIAPQRSRIAGPRIRRNQRIW